MKKIIILFLITFPFFVLGQNNQQIKEYQLNYIQLTNPITCSVSTNVYSIPDSSSKVIDTLNFNSVIVPIEYSSLSDWVLIKRFNDTAYVKRADIALYSFSSSKNDEVLYFITQINQSSVINKYDLVQKQLIDTFVVANFLPDKVEYIDSRKWKNTELIIGLNRDGNCCGCSNNQIYLMDANNNFEIIFKTYQYQGDGDVEEGFSSSIIFPNSPEKNHIIYGEHEYDEEEEKRINKKYQWNGQKIIQK